MHRCLTSGWIRSSPFQSGSASQEPWSSTDRQVFSKTVILPRGPSSLLKAASKTPFSIIGGGHTAAVVEQLGIERDFTHISTGGGACIEFLTGKKLPAVEALERSKELFG